jgi:hypothetical protein
MTPSGKNSSVPTTTLLSQHFKGHSKDKTIALGVQLFKKIASNYHWPNQLLLVGIDVENDTLSILFLHLSLFLSVHHVGKFIVRGVSQQPFKV